METARRACETCDEVDDALRLEHDGCFVGRHTVAETQVVTVAEATLFLRSGDASNGLPLSRGNPHETE